MTRRILLTGAVAAAWTFSAVGQLTPAQTGPEDRSDGSASTPGGPLSDSANKEKPTAEELLDALQRYRPANEPILPVGAERDTFGIEPKSLVPEGHAIVSRTGYLSKDETWWTFQFDSEGDVSSLRILPNAVLEVMVRTAVGASSPVRFAISGEATVFDEDNYLLIRLARRAQDERPTQEAAAQPPDRTDASPRERDAQPNRGDEPPADTPTDSLGAGGATDVDDVLAAMQQQQPGERIIAPPVAAAPVARANPRPDTRTGTAARTLLPDGTPLVRRAGRIIRDDPWWTFVFESDHRDHPEPPMRLLPNQSMELMLRAARREDHGMVFLVSGETTVFQGENYLLPRIATARRDSGNFAR